MRCKMFDFVVEQHASTCPHPPSCLYTSEASFTHGLWIISGRSVQAGVWIELSHTCSKLFSRDVVHTWRKTVQVSQEKEGTGFCRLNTDQRFFFFLFILPNKWSSPQYRLLCKRDSLTRGIVVLSPPVSLSMLLVKREALQHSGDSSD